MGSSVRLHADDDIGHTRGMTVEARLEDESGNVVSVSDPGGGSCDGAAGFDRLIPYGDESYPCLGAIDPYGETTLGPLEMTSLLDDLARLDTSAASDAARRGLRRLKALAQECRDGTDLRLRFSGN